MAGNKEKAEVVQDEGLFQTDTNTLEKPIPAVQSVDYSGAHEKTDPREIALVKKLDRWIMPMLWSMYWLNYVSTTKIDVFCNTFRDAGRFHISECPPASLGVELKIKD